MQTTFDVVQVSNARVINESDNTNLNMQDLSTVARFCAACQQIAALAVAYCQELATARGQVCSNDVSIMRSLRVDIGRMVL